MSRRHFAIAAIAAAMLTSPVRAQQAPAAPAPAAASSRCGGLLCDVYYSGKPQPAPGQPDVASPFDSLPCHDFLCRMFGGHAEASPPVQQAAAEPVAAEPTAPAKAPRHAHHKKHAAKVAKADRKADEAAAH